MTNILIVRQPPGTLPTDETFTHTYNNVSTTWNVSLMKRAIYAGDLPAQLVITSYTESAIRALRNTDLNPERMRQLTDAQIDEPALTVIWLDGLGTTIDGSHRLMERYNRGFKSYRTVLVREPHDHSFRIDFLQQLPDGTIEPIPGDLNAYDWGKFPQHSEEYQKRRT